MLQNLENVQQEEADAGREIRLTALWALCEAGLGGIGSFINAPLIHALTGALGVLTISLLIWNTDMRIQPLFRATLVVLLVKFAVNPLAAPLSYFNFILQPVFCYLSYRYIRNIKIAAITAALICVPGRALFKIALSKGGGGIDLWNIKGSFSPAAMSEAMFSSAIEHDNNLMTLYLIALVVLGFVTGLIAYRLPIRIAEERDIFEAMDPKPDLNELAAAPVKPKKKKRKEKKKRPKKDFTLKQLRLPAILAAIGLWLILNGKFESGWKMISYGILFLVIFTEFLPQFFVPMVQTFILSIFKDDRIKTTHATGAMTELRTCFLAAWRLTGQSARGWIPRAERFVPLFFALALEYEPDPAPNTNPATA